jgi:hypothetical protein
VSGPSSPGSSGGLFEDVGRFVRWYAGMADRYRRNEPAIRRALEAGLRAMEAFPSRSP